MASLKTHMLRAWWKLRRKHIASTEVNLPAGESMTFRVPAHLISPTDRLILRWQCGGCDRNWRKIINAEEAANYGMRIACPICDPDEIASREMTPD